MALNEMEAVYEAQAIDATHPDHWSGPPEMVDRIAERLRTGTGDVVLDVGCGVGGPARRLAALTGCTVLAVDRLERVVMQGARRTDVAIVPDTAVRRGRVRFAVACAEALPCADASVDQVWCLGVVAHVEDRVRFAEEAARVLRPGGALALTEGFVDGTPRFLRSAPMPWHGVTPERLADELAQAGFEEISVERWPGGSADGPTGNDDLDHDLRSGRIRPAMVLARAPYGEPSTGPR